MPGHSGSGATERKPTKRACASLGCVVPFFSHFSRAFFLPVFVLPVTDNKRSTTSIFLVSGQEFSVLDIYIYILIYSN